MHVAIIVGAIVLFVYLLILFMLGVHQKKEAPYIVEHIPKPEPEPVQTQPHKCVVPSLYIYPHYVEGSIVRCKECSKRWEVRLYQSSSNPWFRASAWFEVETGRRRTSQTAVESGWRLY